MIKYSLSLILISLTLSSCSQPYQQLQQLIASKIDKSAWGEFEDKCKALSDTNAVYVYESNAENPQSFNYLAKMIVDKEESYKITLQKLNEFEYRKATKKYETTEIPNNFKEMNGIKNLKFAITSNLSAYDFKNKRFSIGFSKKDFFLFKHDYVLMLDKIEEFNHISVSPEKAEKLVSNLKLGYAKYGDRQLIIDIYFEPIEYTKEKLSYKHYKKKEYKVIKGQIHSMRIYRNPILTKTKIYMLSLVNDELYDMKNAKY